MPIFTTVGAPGANSSANGGNVYAYNAINSGGFTTVAPANPQRTSITFHNPSDVDIFVFPSVGFTGPTSAQGTLVPTVPSTLGGCFTIFASGGSLTITGECQGEWKAFSRTSNTKSLTVMDSNLP